MRADDLILVSVDDHVVEPADLFEQHLAAEFRSEADVTSQLATAFMTPAE